MSNIGLFNILKNTAFENHDCARTLWPKLEKLNFHHKIYLIIAIKSLKNKKRPFELWLVCCMEISFVFLYILFLFWQTRVCTQFPSHEISPDISSWSWSHSKCIDVLSSYSCKYKSCRNFKHLPQYLHDIFHSLVKKRLCNQ